MATSAEDKAGLTITERMEGYSRIMNQVNIDQQILDQRRVKAREILNQIRKDCSHNDETIITDLSGNNETHYQCKLCGLIR